MGSTVFRIDWTTAASIATCVLLAIALVAAWEQWRRPRVKLVVDRKTRELSLEIVNRGSRPLQVRDLGVIPHGRAPLPFAAGSWSNQSPVEARSSLVAKADFDCLLSLSYQCQKFDPHGSVSVRGYFVSGTGKRRRSKPAFYDARTQGLSEKEPA